MACAFAIALTTFSLTVEPTASFWDAGEFISTASKLEIGHPAGGSFISNAGRVFLHICTGQYTRCPADKPDVLPGIRLCGAVYVLVH